MSLLARRLVAAGLLFCVLDLGRDTQAAADTPAQAVEVLRQMPKPVETAKEAVPELLPFPQKVEPEEIIGSDPYGFRPPTRINRYEVWQFYQIGRYGQFRPRVIYSAYGTFYLYDGRPFYGLSTHQLDVMPVLIGIGP
jgi:hypothetical protein